jgi:hypothetical protein
LTPRFDPDNERLDPGMLSKADFAKKFNESVVTNAVEYVYASHDGQRDFVQGLLQQPISDNS